MDVCCPACAHTVEARPVRPVSPQNITTENPSRDVRRFLQHWSDDDFVSEHLAIRFPSIPAATRRTKARTVAGAVGQGLGYLDAAEATPLLTKPLPMFYAAENLSKAVAITLNANLTASDFKSHGISGDDAKRYSIRNLRCKTGTPRNDTWSHFFRASNADAIVVQRTVDGQGLVSNIRTKYPTKLPKPRTNLVFGDLVKHLPELADDIPMVGWGCPYVVHLSSYQIQQTTGPPRNTAVWLTLRHGHNNDIKAMVIGSESSLLKDYTKYDDRLDIVAYQHAAPDLEVPQMRMDVFGDLYVDFKRTRMVLGEPVIYLAALHILSHAVRYNAEQWKRLLDDHPREVIVVDRFLDIALRKLPNLILNELQGDVYQFRFAR